MRRLLLILAVVAPAWSAAASELVTDLSEHLIAITSSFHGTDLLLFGSVQESRDATTVTQGGADIVVVVRGPDQPVVVRRKARVAGIWVNRDALVFDNVPGYYSVLSNRPLSEIAPASVLARHRIGLPYLDLETRQSDLPDGSSGFREAIVRARTRDNLFIQDESAINFLGGTLFKTDVHFPANVPVGNYTTHVYLLRDGQMISAQTSPLFVDKSGIERRIYKLAHDKPAIYGILAVIMAIAAGWLAAAVFRRG
ncbi:MAG: TIGR02186 family protein [Sphingomonadales bacterium]